MMRFAVLFGFAVMLSLPYTIARSAKFHGAFIRDLL